jgi:ligand-binding sensor domain-containing protein
MTFYTITNSWIPSNKVNAVRVDRNGIIWVATDAGLALFDERFSLGVPKEGAGRVKMALDVYPNPTAGESTVRLYPVTGGRMKLSVVNILGEELMVLADRVVDAGKQQFPFNSAGLPAGACFLKVESAGNVDLYPLTVVR